MGTQMIDKGMKQVDTQIIDRNIYMYIYDL